LELTAKQAIDTYQYVLALPDPMKELHTKGMAASTRSRIADSLRNILQANNEIDETLAKESEDLPQLTTSLRQRVRIAVYAGVCLNVLIACALAYYFSRAITARIAIMFANTDRFARRMALLPPVGGDDELSALDSAFHQSVSDARKLENLRQEFLQMVTHDIRAPVTSVKAFLGNIEAGTYGDVPERLLESSKVAERSLSRVYAMVSDLLDLEKLDSGTMKLDPTQVNIRSICQEAIETVSAEANRRDVELTLTSADIQVSADEKRILQVLVNLLSNAVKVAPTKTTVRVQAQVQDGLAKVSVIDQGPGIPKEDLTRVFERFSQVATPRAAPGIGLGLAICRSLVELHGGAIAVFNNEDAGACFSFTIPVQTAEPITALPQSPEPGI
jgi:signal transduction histidine kinase